MDDYFYLSDQLPFVFAPVPSVEVNWCWKTLKVGVEEVGVEKKDGENKQKWLNNHWYLQPHRKLPPPLISEWPFIFSASPNRNIPPAQVSTGWSKQIQSIKQYKIMNKVLINLSQLLLTSQFTLRAHTHTHKCINFNRISVTEGKFYPFRTPSPSLPRWSNNAQLLSLSLIDWKNIIRTTQEVWSF